MATKRTPTFDSHNPATGEVAGTYPIMNAKEVAAVSFEIFKKLGIMEKTETGWQVSKLGEKLLKSIPSY